MAPLVPQLGAPNPVVAAWTLPWRMNRRASKEFHLVADLVREMAPGFGSPSVGLAARVPGPPSEVVEGDRVRIL